MPITAMLELINDWALELKRDGDDSLPV